MMKVQPKTMIYLSGAIWFFTGFLLTWKGMGYFEKCLTNFHPDHFPMLSYLKTFVGGISEAIIASIFTSMLFGMVKGRFVLKKSAHRAISRIHGFSGLIPLSRIYPLYYYGIYAIMMGMGTAMSVFGCPIDIRAWIDVAVGSALLNGSMLYFRAAAKRDGREILG